jgi:hypothetical protein
MKILYVLAVGMTFVISASFTFSPEIETTTHSSFEEEDVKFRIKICSYENHVPHDKVDVMRKLGKVKVVKKGNVANYYSKEYPTEQQATSQLPFYINAGFEDAVEAVEINNEFYSLDKYHKMLEDKQKEEKDPVIRIYK